MSLASAQPTLASANKPSPQYSGGLRPMLSDSGP